MTTKTVSTSSPKVCPGCGQNHFEIRMTVNFTAKFDDDGILVCTLKDARNAKSTCSTCGYNLNMAGLHVIVRSSFDN